MNLELRAYHKEYKMFLTVVAVDLETKNILTGSMKDLDLQDVFNYEKIVLEPYTGLNDKNQIKIFEGDVVKMDGYLYKIVWFDESCAFKMIMIDKDGWTNELHILELAAFKTPHIEIVGNIHE